MARAKPVRAAATNQFESVRYRGFSTWQKVVFWIGVISFLNLSYWIVRLVIYIVLKDRPLAQRIDAYALQTLIFGWIGVVAIIIMVLVLLFFMPFFVMTSVA